MSRGNAAQIAIQAVKDLISQTPDEILSSLWVSTVEALSDPSIGIPPEKIQGWWNALTYESGASLLRKYLEESISQEGAVSDRQLIGAIKGLMEGIVEEIKARKAVS